MTQTTGRILKGNEVSIEGKYQLGFPQTGHKSAQQISIAAKSPQARIIENSESCVVIQVVCSCGKHIDIRGEYITSRSSQQS
ncbi:MAG: hypothetical protein P8016_03580 [Sedimentisphaerales bacterium]